MYKPITANHPWAPKSMLNFYLVLNITMRTYPKVIMEVPCKKCSHILKMILAVLTSCYTQDWTVMDGHLPAYGEVVG